MASVEVSATDGSHSAGDESVSSDDEFRVMLLNALVVGYKRETVVAGYIHEITLDTPMDIVVLVSQFYGLLTSNVKSLQNPITKRRLQNRKSDNTFNLCFDETVKIHLVPYDDPSRLDHFTDIQSNMVAVEDIVAMDHIIHRVESNNSRNIFDSITYVNDTYMDKLCLISSDALCGGYYEWTIKIVKCNIYTQEIGIVSVNKEHIQNMDIQLNKDRVIMTKDFGARVVYGSDTCTKSVFYGSYNNDGKERCYRDLRCGNWKIGDIIKISLDINKSKVTFFLNGNKVRKAISLETINNEYYPIIAFSGNSVYELLSFQSL